MKLLCIDPGSYKSAWVVFDTAPPAPGCIINSGIYDNEELLRHLRFGHFALNGDIDKLLIEQIKSYGNAMGDEVIGTVYWSGRFIEAASSIPFELIPRKTIVTALCNHSRAKDANVRAALIDLWGGKSRAIGAKKCPGPLYGIKADVWSALAIAVVGAERMGHQDGV